MALEDSVNNLVTQTTNLLNTVNVAKSTLDTAVASASASASAAAASYDQFDDRYLGPKSADPSLDNDGNALLEGAIYWNTTAKEFRVWNGSAWQADTIVGGTVASLNTTGSLQEGGVDVVVQTDIGTAPNEIPLNQYLGSMAYQDAENIAGDVGVGGDLSLDSGTANGVVYLNGSKVATSGSGLVFNGSNLGLGVTPSAWISAGARTLQVGSRGVNFAGYTSAPVALVTTNAFINSSSAWEYVTTNPAGRYELNNNEHRWFTAPSGTAGNAISFTQAMTLDASGNLLLGRTSSSNYRTQITGASDLVDIAGTSVSVQFHNKTADVFTIGAGAGDSIAFATNGNATERLRIDSSGNVGIGTSSPSASAILDAQSTTKGVRMPNMTTAQKNAIASPAAGLMVFDTTLSKLCVYTGVAWETVTSI